MQRATALYLDVSKTGAKAWTFIYYREKSRIQLGLGPLRGILLQQARAKADELHRMLGQGIDPKAQLRFAPGAPTLTFGALALEVMDAKRSCRRNPKSEAQWRSSLQTYAVPIWNKYPADIRSGLFA